jgi:ATP-dependent Clp protease ATP-binding subunit ClpA
MGLCGDLSAADLSAFTGRAVQAFALARDAADRAVTTAHLLDGLIAEGGNLALEVLRSMEIDPQRLARPAGRCGRRASTSARPAGR